MESTMSVFEAASILMDLSTFKCNQEDLKEPTRKREAADSVSDPGTEIIFIPKRPRSTGVKKMEESTQAAAAAPLMMRDTIFIPRRPRTPRVEIMKPTATAIATAAPPMRDMELVNFEEGQSSKASPKVKKRKRATKAKEIDLTATPEMPAAMRERILEMGGYEIELVIQKQLHDTDLNKNQGRLSLPIKKLKFDFATEEEIELLNRHVDKKNKIGINVMIIDPSLRETVICLKKWKIGSGDVYCMMTHWNSFVQQNSLKSGEVVQVWSFRKDGVDVANQTENPHHLCFAIAMPHVSEFI